MKHKNSDCGNSQAQIVGCTLPLLPLPLLPLSTFIGAVHTPSISFRPPTHPSPTMAARGRGGAALTAPVVNDLARNVPVGFGLAIPAGVGTKTDTPKVAYARSVPHAVPAVGLADRWRRRQSRAQRAHVSAMRSTAHTPTIVAASVPDPARYRAHYTRPAVSSAATVTVTDTPARANAPADASTGVASAIGGFMSGVLRSLQARPSDNLTEEDLAMVAADDSCAAEHVQQAHDTAIKVANAALASPIPAPVSDASAGVAASDVDSPTADGDTTLDATHADVDVDADADADADVSQVSSALKKSRGMREATRAFVVDQDATWRAAHNDLASVPLSAFSLMAINRSYYKKYY